MQRYDGFESDPYEPYQSPPYIPPYDSGGEGEYFGLPFVSMSQGAPVELVPREGEGQYFGLPPGPRDYAVSRVGPTVSARPIGPASLNVPAGSLLTGRSVFGLAQAFKRGGRYPIQRGFTVDAQEKLRRRRRGRLFG
jgi:hypothetical protein